jgi:hypothetical protein
MTINSSSDEFVIRPCREEYKQMLKATPAVLIAVAIFPAIQQGVAGIVIGLVTAAVCFTVMHFYFRGVHIVLTPTEIGRSGFTSRRWMRPRSDIAAVVVGHIYLSLLDSRIAENVFLLDRSGRTIIRLRSTHWSQADRTEIVERLGIPPLVHEGLVNPPEFAKSYPKALPWYERLTFGKILLLSFAFVILLIAAIAVVVVMTTGV